MQLHNTLTGRKEDFEPARRDRVTMYVCGPTVYGFAHIGNARPAVVFDVLARTLRRHFGGVAYVRNITDIDDKINAAAQREGVPISVIADRYVAAYHEDLAALGVQAPDMEPRVTEHLPQIIAMIERLVASGHAYAAEGHVLFHVPSFAGYGELSRRDLRERLAGARVEVAPYKRDDGDFVLWKPSDDALPGWPSPWGRGRPGWHIECSAMAESLLGDTLDIHGGGHDLVFPHHENERAQSECAHDGRPLARFWVHNGFVTMAQAKMAKSVGNVLLVRDLLKEAPGEVIRLALMSAHYHQPLDWSPDTLPDARRKLDRLYGALRHVSAAGPAGDPGDALNAFYAALDDDLNTPAALAELFEIARALNRSEGTDALPLKAALLAGGGALGLLQGEVEAWFAPSAEGSDLDTDEIDRLVAERTAAKGRKDYAEADRIRKALSERGIQLEDSAQGTRWRVSGTA